MKRPRFYGRRTKIICTIGPATRAAAVIERLIKSGMDIARFNLSHGTLSEHARSIQTVRKLSQRAGKDVAILIDLPGPKYRIGKLKDGQATLRKGTRVILTTRQADGDSSLLPVNLPNLPQDVKAGDTILLDDGAMELRVRSIDDTEIKCQVTVGGLLLQGRGLVIPGRHISVPFITEPLREGITFATKQQADYVALSFVTGARDISDVRSRLRDDSSDIPVIAKIERGEAIKNFDKILSASDGIMVARGDLGVEIPLERVPLVQKEIIQKCNRAGKPVITATEMLESMIHSMRPTRAETSDVANAIFDGTDAIMLSAETSIGSYPVQSVRTMAKIAREVEKELPYEQILTKRGNWLERTSDELISYNACYTAHRLGATAIVAFTQSGSTAGRVSKCRPRIPVLAITSSRTTSRRLLIRWGVYPLQVAEPSSVDELFTTGARLARDLGLARPGDLIVITGGIPIGQAGSTNLLKVEKVD
jgi:pyruvate kinase